MKNILIMRHAKSDWSDHSLSDFERPLNKRGKKAAPRMAEEIKRLNIIPDAIVSSPAKRAKMTAKIVAKDMNFASDILWDSDFYFGSASNYLKALYSFSDEIERVLLIGHNPTVEDLVHSLSDTRVYLDMPTAALVSLSIDIKTWKELSEHSCKFDWIIKPKELPKS